MSKYEDSICCVCNADGWHFAWCPKGTGPAPRVEAGVGTGRKLLEFELKAEQEFKSAQNQTTHQETTEAL